MSRVVPTVLAVLSFTAVASLAHAQMGPGMRPNYDADGDGVVTASEFEAVAKQRFDRMDANHDGVIDAGEIAAIRARMEERRGDRPDGGGGGGRPDMLAELDANNDGQITQAEALAASAARFAKLDKNGDGKLDAAEQEGLHMGRPGGGGRGGSR